MQMSKNLLNKDLFLSRRSIERNVWKCDSCLNGWARAETPKEANKDLRTWSEQPLRTFFQSRFCCDAANNVINMNKSTFFILLIAAIAVTASPLGKSRYRATHVKPERFDLSRLFVWPNSYYDVPRHRYPYYDQNGTGRVLYGYGGQTLYEYSIFKPLEGYFKRRWPIFKSIFKVPPSEHTF